jgi:EAL domain-containing protein (putative c-di-GMP-specific phosphodiesterase class I)
MYPQFSSPVFRSQSPILSNGFDQEMTSPLISFNQLPQATDRFKFSLLQYLTTALLKLARNLESRLRSTTPFVFEPNLPEESLSGAIADLSNHNFAKELSQALEREELFLDYQPQIDLETGKLSGVESLVRWHHPRLGRISPADFIPIAEETGLIIPMGYWILRRACQQYQQWQSLGIAPFKLSVNLSLCQLKDPNLVSVIRSILIETEINPDYLELEITESFMVSDISAAIATLTELRELGIQIAIDDFGTGYSSLSSLKNLPIQTLKIDKSFLDDLSLTNKNQVILQSIIELGHRLKLQIIAEGIENEGQLKILKTMNCDCGQGYFLSRPLHLEALIHYFRQVKLGIHLPQLLFS